MDLGILVVGVGVLFLKYHQWDERYFIQTMGPRLFYQSGVAHYTYFGVKVSGPYYHTMMSGQSKLEKKEENIKYMTTTFGVLR